MQNACAALSSVACLAVQYFSTLFHKPLDFREYVTEHKMWVLIFSKRLSETFFILRRNERDVIINVYWSLCKLFLSADFNETWIFSTDSKNNQILNFTKIRPVGTQLFHEDGWKDGQTERRTGRHDELTVAFCNFVNMPKQCKNEDFISRLRSSLPCLHQKLLKFEFAQRLYVHTLFL
jgi:hypothetical protein